MIVECHFCEVTFHVTDEKFYGCLIECMRIPVGKVLEFVGQHKNGKSNDDVIHVKFRNCAVSRVPQGLTKAFPNMKNLDIKSSKLTKLTKADLVEYKNLERFLCDNNQLEFLSGDLFEDFKNLAWVSFWENKLQLIEPNILDGLESLKVVDFKSNSNYDIKFSAYDIHKNDLTLNHIKNYIYEKFFKSVPLEYLQDVKMLRKSEENLKREVERLRSEVQKLNEERVFGDIKSYIQNKTFKDFKIEIDGREFPVHKFLLTIRSPAFAEMLRNNPEAQKMTLVDIPVEVFEVILKFLYTNKLPNDKNLDFLNLFASANRLEIKGLQDYAAEKLLGQVSAKNAIEVLFLSNKYEHDELRQKAFEEINKKYPKIEFDDNMATDTEKIVKVIRTFTEKEEAIMKLEENFKNLLVNK